MNFELINVLWVLMASGLVFMMQAGFLCLEAGLTRTKNTIHVAVKNIADFGVSMLMFWAVGYGLMFGISHGGWIGTGHLFADVGHAGNMWHATMFLFQAMFCGTAVTIVSGAVAERIRFLGYLAVVVLVSLLYPLYGHWAWGEGGWLKQLGFVDFAGSSVVHSMGGWVALAACLVIGPRLGVFDQKRANFSGSNLPLAMLGVLLLWFGWIGFNGGSTLALNEQVPGIVANTMLAASAGLIAAMALSLLIDKHIKVSTAINGPLAGLVAITAGCHAMGAAAAVLTGAVGAALAWGSERLLVKWKIDDVIGAIPVHLVAGAWGTLAVALLGRLPILETGLDRWSQLGVQALGIAMCGGVGLVLGGPVLWLMHKTWGLRVTAEEEHQGLNHAEHRATNDLLNFVGGLEDQIASRDLSRRVDVEPFTEVGMIAERFNELMDVVERSTTDIEHLKETRHKLMEAKAIAEQANQTKSEFLANMSHEIRTPLHGILSFAGFGLKRADTVSPEKLKSYFEKIDLSGHRLLHLVNDLLDLSKLEAGQMVFEFEKRPVSMVIAGVVDEMESLLSECRIQVKLHNQAKGAEAELDAIRLMQVVRNVLNNAVKFSPANAVIDVTLSHVSAQDRAVDASAVLLQSHATPAVRIDIADQGPGIPEAELHAVFDKFIQSSKTKSGAGGTGLGLSICREIVQGHHGQIWVNNRPEGGAVFSIELPTEQPAAMPVEPATDKETAATPSGMHGASAEPGVDGITETSTNESASQGQPAQAA